MGAVVYLGWVGWLMAEARKPVDWERIELDYRAGILSVREISEARGVSHTAINKKAKLIGWERDLKAKIKAKADALVSKAEVSKVVSKEKVETEKNTIDTYGQVIADVRLGQRNDINRARRLANKLLDELEGLTDNRELFAELGDLLRTEDSNGQDRRNDLYQKIIDLPSRSKTMKEMSDTLKTLITLEREAYDIAPPAKVEVTGANGEVLMPTMIQLVAVEASNSDAG